MLSVEAFQESETLEASAPVLRRPVGTVGGWVSSAGSLVVTFSAALAGERLPLRSLALTVKVYSVLGVRPVTVALVSVTVVASVPSL